MPLGLPLLLNQVKDARVKGRVILGLSTCFRGQDMSRPVFSCFLEGLA